MFYRKTLPGWEGGVRLVGAAVMGLCAMQFAGTPAAWAFGVTGAVFATTSVAGFCPFCAIGGRKLKAREKQQSD
jgi:hypothetical protein